MIRRVAVTVAAVFFALLALSAVLLALMGGSGSTTGDDGVKYGPTYTVTTK